MCERVRACVRVALTLAIDNVKLLNCIAKIQVTSNLYVRFAKPSVTCSAVESAECNGKMREVEASKGSLCIAWGGVTRLADDDIHVL